MSLDDGDKIASPGKACRVSARRVVVALAILDLASWVLALAWGDLPSRGYVLFDLVVGTLLLVGLWFFWRVAWLVATWATVLGVVRDCAQFTEDWSGRRAVLLMIGFVYLALLMVPPLRSAMRPLRGRQVA
jgi:hypothetical protein